MKALIVTIIWFGGAVLFVLAMMVSLFSIGFLDDVSILFYRGLLIIGASEVICFGVLLFVRRHWPGWHVRDAVSACALASGVAVCFLIVLPVTIDRSVSVFLLGRMSAEPDRNFTPSELETIFVRTYVQRYDQIKRRMEEQRVSGNVAKTTEGYRISEQGAAFVQFGLLISKAFQTDARFVDPERDAYPPNGAAPRH